MEGGGDRDTGRARSPLPAELQARDGEDIVRRRQRVAELEAQQRKLLALARGPQAYVREGERSDEPRKASSGDDEKDVDAVIARLQAQIDRQVSDYNKRPKRLTYGINAVGVSYARYVDEWAARIERLGTERYPPEARGKLYDSLIITVEIDKHGNVVDVIINRKSKYDVLNRAVKQIVYAGAPYERFTPEMAREGDILQIVRTWTFTNDSLETASRPPARAPMTDSYAVVGNPVAHSRSPSIHARFAKQTGHDIEYGRLLAPLDGFVEAVERFRDAGRA